MLATRRTGERPRGITLLELLIVMVIMLMVTAAAIPMVAPALRNRQMREATRLVSAYFGAARARAVQTGRPVGIMVERFNGGAFALQMSQIEVPPPYSGDIVGATLQVGTPTALGTTTSQSAKDAIAGQYGALINAGTMGIKWYGGIEPAAGMLNTKLVRVGDQIQFNNQGPWLTVCGPDANKDGVIDAISTTAPLDICYLHTGPLKQALPWENVSPLPVPQAATYRVLRQPVRSSAQPLILPDGIVVDLSVSGVGSDLFNTADYSAMADASTVNAPLVNFDPIIIFSPSGRLDYVTNRSGQMVRPTGSVNLLLGRRELMFDVTNKGDAKDIVFQNLGPIPTPSPTTLMPPVENFWITVGYQTGQVSVSQVAPSYQTYDGTGVAGVNPSTKLAILNLALNGNGTTVTGALSFAKESQSLGGR